MNSPTQKPSAVVSTAEARIRSRLPHSSSSSLERKRSPAQPVDGRGTDMMSSSDDPGDSHEPNSRDTGNPSSSSASSSSFTSGQSTGGSEGIVEEVRFQIADGRETGRVQSCEEKQRHDGPQLVTKRRRTSDDHIQFEPEGKKLRMPLARPMLAKADNVDEINPTEALRRESDLESITNQWQESDYVANPSARDVLWDEEEPSTAFEFDTVPAPPQYTSGRSTMYSGSLMHGGALRRVCLDLGLRVRVVPAEWVRDDDPQDSQTIVICGKKYPIPLSFDSDLVCKGQERELERAEAKFRSGRKDKVIGGELGSFLSKKRPQRHTTTKSRGYGFSATGRRMSFSSVSGDQTCKRLRFMGVTGADYDNNLYIDDDDTYEYRKFATTDLIKAVRAWIMQANAQQRMARGIAAACARDGRKRLIRTVRMADDAYRRGRRVFRDVMAFWRKEDKERLEERKRLFAEADAVKRREAEEREEQRQRNKLKFLLGQSEAFSSFLQAKVQATTQAAKEDVSKSDHLQQPQGIDGITGTEDDDELYRKAKASAAELAAAHRARLDLFDRETRERQGARPSVTIVGGKRTGLPDERRAGIKKDTARSSREGEDGGMGKGAEISSSEKPEVVPVKQPKILTGKMKDYQLRGLSWLVSLYDQGINGILADEMGLGKTVQTISFLAYLAEKENNWGPFLVVTPKATLHNWQQEVSKFCPLLRILPYWGSKSDRKELRKHWSPRRMYRKDSEFHVCVTSYEILTTDEKYFPRVKWQYVVLDEAQAIKNSSSIRWKALLQFPCRNRLLLTGTPLQNKMSELWSLLHFIMPTIFDSHAEFADWFAKDIEGHAQQNKILDKSTIERLRTLLDPFMLRRVKRDVENEMPPKVEVEVRCELTPRQRHLYSSIKRNVSMPQLLQSIAPSKLSTGSGKASHGALMNLVMQLRKVCNHPETFQRRSALSPFQFQLPTPPSHSPLAHAVLAPSNGPQPPQKLNFVTLSPIPHRLPRLLHSLSRLLEAGDHLKCTLLGLWGPNSLKESHLFTLFYLSGGVSVGEGSRTMRSSIMDLWVRRDIFQDIDRNLSGVECVYGFWKGQEEYTQSDGRKAKIPTKRLHRLLTGIRARSLALQETITLSCLKSPADIIERETRMLKSMKVYVPAVTCPPIIPYYPGDPRHSFENSRSFRFWYPMAKPRRPFAEQYKVWRALLGNYGFHTESTPIVMPEAGRLVADAGKMKVLDKLLKQLKDERHKCLIYSQFTRVLDILEDYCGSVGMKYLRLDGQSSLSERRDMVANWQSNDDLFVFLLSTRAGGVGINLTAADTVIFYDSDWNPTSDSQAMDRAHRLGQERPVTVYRLVTVGTIEERMLLRAKQKKKINELVIKGGGVVTTDIDENEANIDDLATLLMGEDELRNSVGINTDRKAVEA